jgi:hypothetical protein
MKLRDIKTTQWFKNFKKECPYSYDKALEYALNPNIIFTIHQSDETGENLYVIDCDGFWMDGFKCKGDAIHLCEEMGWKYK